VLVAAALLASVAVHERFGTSTFASSNSSPLCYNCHGNDFAGLSTRDFVLSPFPLQ
jgi:hypothetical protein